MLLDYRILSTLVRDCLFIIKADGAIEEQEIERLESVLQPIMLDSDPKSMISYVVNSIDHIENIYPKDDHGLQTFLDATYKVLISSSQISSKAINEFSKISTRMGVSNTAIFDEYLENIDLRIHNTNNSINLTLKDGVKKLSVNELGVFARAYEDLGVFTEDYTELVLEDATYDEKLLMMAYAYARRSVSCALVAQGIWGWAELAHQVKLFKNFQFKTIQTKDFQESANDQAEDFINSYDERLLRSVVSKIVAPVLMTMQLSPKTARDYGITYTLDEMLES
jgi:hypothetical protein